MRCKDFYEKWEKTPNWCEKCKSAVQRIDRYLALVDNFENDGIKRETTFRVLSEQATTPLIDKLDPQVKAEAISEIEQSLKHKQEQLEKNRIKPKPIPEWEVAAIVKKAEVTQKPDEAPKEITDAKGFDRSKDEEIFAELMEEVKNKRDPELVMPEPLEAPDFVPVLKVEMIETAEDGEEMNLMIAPDVLKQFNDNKRHVYEVVNDALREYAMTLGW